MNKAKQISTEHMEALDDIIRLKVSEILHHNIFPKDYDDTYTDTFAEIIEKMIITHIRQWFLENEMGRKHTYKEIAELKKLMDINFKVKRPALIKACDKMITQISLGKIKYPAESLKRYIKDGKIAEARI